MKTKRTSRRGQDPGIVRIELPAHPRCQERYAFRATARLRDQILTRVFTDAEYLGEDGARDAARAWRSQQLERAGLPDPVLRRLVLKQRSATGIVGISYRPASTERSATAAWIASYETVTGEKKSRSFSVGRYGDDDARGRAIGQRAQWEREDLGKAVAVQDPEAVTSLPLSARMGLRQGGHAWLSTTARAA